MVGIVIVSHSENIAKGVVELCKQMAPEVPIAAAGGLPGGGIGTDFERIYNAVEQVKSPEGVAILFDMGSALMTTEMVMEQFGDIPIRLVNAPIVEGAVVASVAAAAGESLETVLAEAQEGCRDPKL